MIVPEITRIVRCNDQTVRIWIKRFNAEGINGLYDLAHPGRQWNLSHGADVVQGGRKIANWLIFAGHGQNALLNQHLQNGLDEERQPPYFGPQPGREGRYRCFIRPLFGQSVDKVFYGTGLPPGRESVRGWVTSMAAAFPDHNLSVDDLIAEGGKVITRSTFSGTHLGEMEGIPATGKYVTQPAITIFRLLNGKIVEGWYATDNLSMMQQLGVISAPQTD